VVVKVTFWREKLESSLEPRDFLAAFETVGVAAFHSSHSVHFFQKGLYILFSVRLFCDKMNMVTIQKFFPPALVFMPLRGGSRQLLFLGVGVPIPLSMPSFPSGFG